MYKQILYSIFFFFLNNIYSQQIPVFEAGKKLGYLYSKANSNCNNCYSIDTINIFNRKIAIKEPVFIQGDTLEDSIKERFMNQYSLDIATKGKYRILKFNNTSDGSSNWLYFLKKKNDIYIVKQISYSNGIMKKELGKNDFDYLPATLICKKTLDIKIVNSLSYFDYFNWEKESNCYYSLQDMDLNEGKK